MTAEIGFVYCVTNRINGHRYFGKTVQKPAARWKSHIACARRGFTNSALHAAIRKYGVDAFRLRVMRKCGVNELDVWESHYIKKYKTDSTSAGYNLTAGGDGVRWVESVRQRQRASLRAYYADPVVRAAHGERIKRTHAEDPTLRGRLSAAGKGRKIPAATRANMSAALKKRWSDPAQVAAQSARIKKFWADRKAAGLAKAKPCRA